MQLALDGLDGVKRVRVLVSSKDLAVTYDPQRISPNAIIQAIRHAPAAGESGNYDAALLPGAAPGGPLIGTPVAP